MGVFAHIRRTVNRGDGLRVKLVGRAVEHLAALLQGNDAIGILDGVIDLMQIHQAGNAQFIGHPAQHFHGHT